jgi:hypothetical protein
MVQIHQAEIFTSGDVARHGKKGAHTALQPVFDVGNYQCHSCCSESAFNVVDVLSVYRCLMGRSWHKCLNHGTDPGTKA